MNTKSRYEVIAELEAKKRLLIVEKAGISDVLREKEIELRDLKREIEDKEEEVKIFKGDMKEKEITIDALIKSVDDSLNRFNELNKS